MTTPVTPVRPVRPLLRTGMLPLVLTALAALFFVLAALVDGGVFPTASGWGWLVPGGLASLTVALLCP
jgi:hypothetical protein